MDVILGVLRHRHTSRRVDPSRLQRGSRVGHQFGLEGKVTPYLRDDVPNAVPFWVFSGFTAMTCHVPAPSDHLEVILGQFNAGFGSPGGFSLGADALRRFLLGFSGCRIFFGLSHWADLTYIMVN